MRRKDNLPELLSPAGDMQCLYAAVKGGADAIYVGGKAFGARAYAKNFSIDELAAAAKYCHLHGVKLYVTVNTLVYDKEMEELSDFVAELWRVGVDAVITADLGAIGEIKRRVPGMPIHASTQMSVHNTDGADAAFMLGCERVVVARELSSDNIRSVTENSKAEIEAFLHGALCVCHSGQCLMSSLVGGRSGNRGECAQPCRLPYSNKYPLSLSDLSLAGRIRDLIDLGVSSLKIEGRMKSPEYVYTVTSIYRRLLDEGRNATASEIDELRRVFSRGEFTESYFTGNKFDKMTGVRSEGDKEMSRAIAPMEFSPELKSLKAFAKIKLGEPATLTLALGDGRSATAIGQIPSEAINAPLTECGVKERLAKMGGTYFTLSPDDIELALDGGVNLPPSAINALRREAAEALLSLGREPVSNNYEPAGYKRAYSKPMKTALFLKANAYKELIKRGSPAAGSFDVAFLPIDDFADGANGVYLPPVITDGELCEVKSLLSKLKERGAKYALVGNIGHVAIAKRAGLVPIGDFRLNITNRGAREYYKTVGVLDAVLSPELTLPMARDIGGAEIVYGRIPLMLTERCFIKENFGCERCDIAFLTDRTGAKFPLIKEFGHRNLLLNSIPTYMGDRKKELESASIKHTHFIFSIESADEVERVIKAYDRSAALTTEVRRIGKR